MAKKETKKKIKEQQEKAKKADKKKKGERADAVAQGGGAAVNAAGIDRSQMTADQMTQVQIEEAIKESQDPSSKLRKLRSPLSVKNCLLNLLILVVVTVGIVILCCYLMLDRETFNLWVVLKDILDKFRITEFFKNIGAWFKKIFS